MGKYVNDLSNDAALDYTIDNANQLHVCVGQPVDRTAALAAALASGSAAAVDFTKANGDTSGRKYTCAAQTGLSIGSDGNGDHIVVTSLTEILDITTCTSQALTSGGTVDVAAFEREIADPV